MEVLINVKDCNNEIFKKDLYTVDELIEIIEDLKYQIENLQEENEELKQQIEDNYRPLSAYELTGMSESDFCWKQKNLRNY